MNKKQVRFAIIAALVVLFVGVSIFSLKVEPANAPANPNDQIVADNDPAQSDAEQNPAGDDLPDDQTEDGEKPAEDGNTDVDGADNKTGEDANTKPGDKTDSAGQSGKDDTKTPDSKTPNKDNSQSVTGDKTPAAPAAAGGDKTAAYPADKAAPPENPTDEKLHCTIEIRCDTVVDTSKLTNQAVVQYVPADGVVLATKTVEFTDGETVFDVLKRATRANDVQMEFREDALYSGAYIEGINYLYEFDAGDLSGWMYKVNGQFPNYGCASYYLADGDAVVWMYTCDLGRDVGDNSVW